MLIFFCLQLKNTRSPSGSSGSAPRYSPPFGCLCGLGFTIVTSRVAKAAKIQTWLRSRLVSHRHNFSVLADATNEVEEGGPKVLPCSACQEKGVDIDYEVHAGTYKSYLATQVCFLPVKVC